MDESELEDIEAEIEFVLRWIPWWLGGMDDED